MEDDRVFHSSLRNRILTRERSAYSGSNEGTIAKQMPPAALPYFSLRGVPVRWPAALASSSTTPSMPMPSRTSDSLPYSSQSSHNIKVAGSRPCACVGGSNVARPMSTDTHAQPDCHFAEPSCLLPQLPCSRYSGVFPASCHRRSLFGGPLSVPSLVLMLLFSLWCSRSPTFSVSPSPATAQVVSYNAVQAPAPFSAVPQRGAFFLYGKGTRFYFPFFTSSGGTSSDKPRDSTIITFKNLRFSEDSSTVIESTLMSPPSGAGLPPGGQVSALNHHPVSPAGVEVSLLPYEYTRIIFSSPSVAPFCCTTPSPSQTFIPTAQCPYPGALKREVHASSASPAPFSASPTADAAGEVGRPQGAAAEGRDDASAGAMKTAGGGGSGEGTTDKSDTLKASAVVPSSSAAAGSGSSSGVTIVASSQYSQPVELRSSGPQEVTLEVKEGGIYFLVISNCGEFAQLTFDGEIQVRNAYGFLPGHEYPKMPFYFSFMLVYLGVCFFWGFLLYRQRANLIPFHKCMLLVAALGFLECMALFVYYSDFNMRGSRNSVLLVLSVLVSVVKNIFSYMLVLLGAIGWSITIPVLDRKTILKMQIVVVLYIILDTARQVSDEFSHSHSLPLILLLTCLFPISALNGLLFYWIISSINSNVEMLQQQKQHEKLLMYKRLYAVLLLAIFLAIVDLLCQIYVASWDSSFPWKNQWWLSDAVPHMLFLLVLAAMMFIWRPNHQSKRLAYFTELGDADDLERAAGDHRGKNVWGEELDFHDHFSEEELEAGIPNFQLHSVGSMSDEGELSDGEQMQVAEIRVPDLRKNEGREEHRSISSSRAPTAASSSGSGRSPQQQQYKVVAGSPAAGAVREEDEDEEVEEGRGRAGRVSGRRAGGGVGAAADTERSARSSRLGADVGSEGSVELASTATMHASGSSKKAATGYQ